MWDKLVGKSITKGSEWFIKNDPETLSTLLNDDDCEFTKENIMIRIEFDEGGSRAYVWAKENSKDSLTQLVEPWWDDEKDDWEEDIIEVYHNHIFKQNMFVISVKDVYGDYFEALTLKPKIAKQHQVLKEIFVEVAHSDKDSTKKCKDVVFKDNKGDYYATYLDVFEAKYRAFDLLDSQEYSQEYLNDKYLWDLLSEDSKDKVEELMENSKGDQSLSSKFHEIYREGANGLKMSVVEYLGEIDPNKYVEIWHLSNNCERRDW